MKLTEKYSKILVWLSGALLLSIVVVVIFEGELIRPWKKYQRQFVKLDRELTAKEIETAKQLPEGEKKSKTMALLAKRQEGIESQTRTIKQLWLTDFNTADRCITCHQGAEFSRFKSAPQPLTTHPGKHIAPDRHPVEQYGCVICHAGQGVALTVEEAHGEAENWVKPFLPGTRAESSCVGCHPFSGDLSETAKLEDADKFSSGRTLYMQKNCLGCHSLSGYMRPKSIGPILTNVSTKTTAGWIRYWVKSPKQYLSQTVMPDFELPDEEIKAMTGYLMSLNTAPLGTGISNEMDQATLAETGKRKLEDLGCLGCHAIDGKDGGFGPDLSRVGEKSKRQWLAAWIKDPKKYWAETAMPNLRVPDEDIQILAAYLTTLKGPKSMSFGHDPLDTELVARGKDLIRDKGCTGCHKIGEFPLGYNAPEHNGIGVKRVDELVFADTTIPHTLSDWLSLKVKNPRAFNTKEMPTLMPKFGFSDEEAEELLTFLLSIRKHDIPAKYVSVLDDPSTSMMQGEKLISENNCRGCHKIGARDGATEDVNGGTIGPDLSFEGERVNPMWLAGFIMKPVKIRPLGVEPTRMPTFGFFDTEADSLTAYFAGISKASFPYYAPVKKKMEKTETEEAWKFFWQNFACQACHSWNGEGGIVGPDQSNLGNRLRKEWIAKWLKNPQSFIPDVRMPNFELYPEEIEKFTELLQGFTDISPGVWQQIKSRWEDELLLRQSQQMGGN